MGEPYPYGLPSRKSTGVNGLKGSRIDSSSFLDTLPLTLSSDNQHDMGQRGVFGGYEFNNGWRNFKAIMRKHSFRDSFKKTGNVGTLDSIIPPPKDFEGSNNPFRAFNQEPPILFPQTTLSNYDILNSSSRSYFNRRQRRLYNRNRYSFSSSRKNSINSSGDATPERDMDCSSSCSNSVDENITSVFSNPPPLLDFSEPLSLAPPSPPLDSSKVTEPSHINKSPPGLELCPPPAALQTCSTLPVDSNRISSQNNNKPTLGMNGTVISSIKHKATTLGDLKCPSITNSATSDGAESRNLSYKDTNPSIDSKIFVNARRLTLDGDVQYLFDRSDEEKLCSQKIKEEELTPVSLKQLDDKSTVKKEIDSRNNYTMQDPITNVVQLPIKKEKVDEDIKKEVITKSDS